MVDTDCLQGIETKQPISYLTCGFGVYSATAGEQLSDKKAAHTTAANMATASAI